MTDFVTRTELEQRLEQHTVAMQQRIDGAVAQAAVVQEQRWASMQTQLKTDIGTAVESAVGRVVGNIEQRLYQAERDGHDARLELRELHRTVHGDPDERSGHPSIFEMFKDIQSSIQVLTGQIDLHDDRLEHLEGIEKAAVDFVRWIGKAAHKIVSARLTHFVTAAIALVIKLTPLLIGAIASAFAAASFFMQYLFRIYQ
jgi:hypothetical protein